MLVRHGTRIAGVSHFWSSVQGKMLCYTWGALFAAQVVDVTGCACALEVVSQT
jgi:ribulose 1,5-bisphosphate synthetase/thiazole synthase